ncbi:GAF domain-containing protein [Streptomyces panaciradicis]|uniref:GAF domain-containing protein n=1 Tax=Streptomyces panaciradicis TaxID=1470261 RepID=UPI00201CC7C7|nr:GAF domain-containing protein [Streptomyces panaciradicis]MCL6673823.1 GAF domain-containing protein [Streptomyces panaciradicis]
MCRILVPQLADWAAVDLIEDDGRPRRVSVVHHDPDVLPVGGLTGALPPVPEVPAGPLARVLAGAGPLLLTSADMLPVAQAADPLHARQLELFAQLGTDTAVVAPLRARRQVLGAVTVGRGTGRGRARRRGLDAGLLQRGTSAAPADHPRRRHPPSDRRPGPPARRRTR